MSVLRVYEPEECGEDGRPLDWEKCRSCGGTGLTPSHLDLPREGECWGCGGHGSLKAAALDKAGYSSAVEAIAPYVMTIQDWRAGVTWVRAGGKVHEYGSLPIRCKDCRHPMSEGTWEETQPDDIWLRGEDFAMDWITRMLALGHEPDEGSGRVHYSRCDADYQGVDGPEGCRHGGPGRVIWPESHREDDDGHDRPVTPVENLDGIHNPVAMKEASWRQVDVRTLGFPNDLRPENLAVLCLRCWVARKPTERAFTVKARA